MNDRLSLSNLKNECSFSNFLVALGVIFNSASHFFWAERSLKQILCDALADCSVLSDPSEDLDLFFL